MIRQRLKEFFAGLTKVEPANEQVPIDQNNIYFQLALALEKIGSTGIKLNPSSTSLGVVNCFSENLDSLLKSVMEVNSVLKEGQHIDNGLFYVKRIASIRLDRLLFVEDNFYIDDADEKVMRVLEQIEIYYNYMKEADRANYGVMEHNHRQLYRYTQSLIDFIESLLQHFAL